MIAVSGGAGMTVILAKDSAIGLVNGKANTDVIANIALSRLLAVHCAAVCVAAISFIIMRPSLTSSHQGYSVTTTIEHYFETGRPLRVCGNTADMLAGSCCGQNFQELGDKIRQFGLFDCVEGWQTTIAKAGRTCC